jgi:hypothetical protein
MKIATIRPVHRFLMALLAIWAIAVMARLQLQGTLPLLAGIVASGAAIALLLRLSFTAFTRQSRPLFNVYPQKTVARVALPHNRVAHMHFAAPVTTGARLNTAATTA